MPHTPARETLGFQAEVKQLLDLMIHSLYGNKEIFLRELISNASDAADKLRFEALANNALYQSDAELKVRIAVDKHARTITVSDNGIGMSRDEVVQNIGTIAKSGTREFFQSLTGDQATGANDGAWRAVRHGRPPATVRGLTSTATFVCGYTTPDEARTGRPLLRSRGDRLV